MKILPTTTKPPNRRIGRRHAPAMASGRYGYREYRPCLRWEFGFSCAFCLIHESDVSPSGVEGLGVTTVEHYEPASTDPAALNDYENCFYVCRLCNGARHALPVVGGDGRLLNPCLDVWREHFAAVGDRLQPVPGDRDARYTHESYDLDDERKVRMRKLRRETIEECLAVIESCGSRIPDLMEHFNQIGDPSSLDVAEELWQSTVLAVRQLARSCAIPGDAPAECRCPDKESFIFLRGWISKRSS